VTRTRRAQGTALVLALVLPSLGGCMPAAATDQGRAIDDLWRVFLGGGIVVAGIVWALATWVLLRYRRRAADDLPAQTRGNTLIETVWTLAPLVTVVVLFILTLATLRVTDAQDAAGVPVNVTAFRWGWSVEYPGSERQVVSTADQAPEILLPVGQDVRIRLTSADVAHAFFVPAFVFKRDAIPGRPSTFTIRIANAGTYPGACAEYCGVLHDRMPFTIRAVPADAFSAWLAGGPTP
jgi:cytochrome c oxidase subunit 2